MLLSLKGKYNLHVLPGGRPVVNVDVQGVAALLMTKNDTGPRPKTECRGNQWGKRKLMKSFITDIYVYHSTLIRIQQAVQLTVF